MRITLNLATRPFADLGPAIKRLRIAMAVMVAKQRAPATIHSTVRLPGSLRNAPVTRQ